MAHAVFIPRGTARFAKRLRTVLPLWETEGVACRKGEVGRKLYFELRISTALPNKGRRCCFGENGTVEGFFQRDVPRLRARYKREAQNR